MNSVAKTDNVFFTKDVIQNYAINALIIAGIAATLLCVFASLPKQSIFHDRYIDIDCCQFDKKLAIAFTGSITGISTIAACAGFYVSISKEKTISQKVEKIDRKQAIINRAGQSDFMITNKGHEVSLALFVAALIFFITSILCIELGFDRDHKAPDDVIGFAYRDWQTSMSNQLQDCLITNMKISGIIGGIGIGILCLSSAIGYMRRKKILKSGAKFVNEAQEL